MQITIITAAFRLDGLKKAIESVDNQTYKKIQHIVVNDNNSEIRKWYNNEGNKYFGDGRYFIDFGVRTHYYGAFARNVGTMVSFSYLPERIRKTDKDERILYLDDDNEWRPNHLELLVKACEEHPDATLIGYDIEIRGKKNLDYVHNMNCKISPQNCDIGSFMYKKELFAKYGYFPAGLRYKITYDWALIKKMAEGEGDDKIIILHHRPATFIFYHKER